MNKKQGISTLIVLKMINNNRHKNSIIEIDAKKLVADITGEDFFLVASILDLNKTQNFSFFAGIFM